MTLDRGPVNAPAFLRGRGAASARSASDGAVPSPSPTPLSADDTASGDSAETAAKPSKTEATVE
jgi:hypothetical protein